MSRRRYTEEEFRAAVADPKTRTMADLCRALGLVPRGANYEGLHLFARTRGIDVSQLNRHWQNPVGTIPSAQVAKAVEGEISMAATIRRLGLSDTSSTRRWLRARIEQERLNTAHWRGRGWAAGTRRPRKRVPLASVLAQRRRIQGTRLRELMIAEHVKEHRCEDCELATWRGEPIPLEVDHVNGDSWDNRLENLRLLCPNCHARTPTYRGRNIGARQRRAEC